MLSGLWRVGMKNIQLEIGGRGQRDARRRDLAAWVGGGRCCCRCCARRQGKGMRSKPRLLAAHLPAADRQRLRTAALALVCTQRHAGVLLPAPLVGRCLALCVG